MKVLFLNFDGVLNSNKWAGIRQNIPNYREEIKTNWEK